MKRILPILFTLPLLLGVSGYMGPTDKGNEAYGMGNYEGALGHYREAAESSPKSPEAHYNLGNAYYRLGEYGKAFEEYDAARKLDPKMADADYNAGDALFRMGKYEEALKAYGQAKSLYGEKGDPDTEYNIRATKERIEKKKDQEQKNQQQGKKDKNSGKDDKQKQQPGAGGQGGQKQGGEQGQPAGQPPMSNEELKALMDRQANEEKKLRNYFQPGKDKGPGREDEIEQMLRGMGSGPEKRMPRPGQPYVEKDW